MRASRWEQSDQPRECIDDVCSARLLNESPYQFIAQLAAAPQQADNVPALKSPVLISRVWMSSDKVLFVAYAQFAVRTADTMEYTAFQRRIHSARLQCKD